MSLKKPNLAKKIKTQIFKGGIHLWMAIIDLCWLLNNAIRERVVPLGLATSTFN
jgi:hypothetical protein